MTHPQPSAPPPFAVRFFLSERQPVRENDDLWSKLLPDSRAPRTAGGSDSPLRYGEYFSAVRRFLVRDRGRVLAAAVGRQLGTALQPSDLLAAEIHLEKHGQHAHPARLRVRCIAAETDLVIQLSVAGTGRQILQRDFENLRRLGTRDPWGFLPQVYCMDPGGHPRSPAILLGRWLTGFEEFHLSADPEDGSSAPVVWTPEGPRRLDAAQAAALYRGAARLLTAFYNPETFEQIGQWHHAAGDFVVDAAADPLAVRLITVRSYAPLLEGVRATTAAVLHGLLLFLVNLTIRMRFDRLDGTGKAVVAGTSTVPAVLDGFFDGLRLQEQAGMAPEGLAAGFRRYLPQLSKSDLAQLVHAVTERFPEHIPGLTAFREQRAGHAAALAAAVARYCGADPLHAGVLTDVNTT